MANIPTELRYAKTHEWARLEDDGTVVVGISDHAQSALGDLVFVEVPEAGTEVASGDACAIVESVKAASDVYSPIAGEIIAANEALGDAPEMINQDPYGDGWIMRMKPADAGEIGEMMDAEAYEAFLEEEES
ncbi:MAG: glycine cleavage system protein GcvH [Gammaproteobacteria bacterium]